MSIDISDYGKRLFAYLNGAYDSIREIQRQLREKDLDKQSSGKSNEFQLGDHVLVRKRGTQSYPTMSKRVPEDAIIPFEEVGEDMSDHEVDIPDEEAPVDMEEASKEPASVTSTRLTPLTYPGVYRIVRMHGTQAVHLEDAIDCTRPH